MHGFCFRLFHSGLQAYAKRRAEEEGRVFIPPFDDPLVVAGQGTVGMEILRQFSLPACQGAQASDQQEDITASRQQQADAAQTLPCSFSPQSAPIPNGQQAGQRGSGSPSSPVLNGTLLATGSTSRAGIPGDPPSCCGETTQSCSLHAVFVPVGGGGLIAGIAAYIKTLKPEVCLLRSPPGW